MRRNNKLNLWENLFQRADNVALPCRMQVKINLVDQHNTTGFLCHFSKELWIQKRHSISNVRNHAEHVAIAIAHFTQCTDTAGYG